jgi:signal transduction histidine kinase/Tfp pilus assembly protein PilF
MRILLILFFFLNTILVFAQKPEEATIDSLNRQIFLQKDDSAKARLLLTIAENNIPLNQSLAMKYALDGMALVKKMKWQKGEAEFYRIIGYIFQQLNQPDSMTAQFNTAFEVFKGLNLKDGMARLMNDFGRYHLNKAGNPAKATDYFFKGLKLAEESENTGLIVLLTKNISVVYSTQMNHSKALEYALKALSLAEKKGTEKDITVGLEGVSNAYLGKSDTIPATQYFNRLLTMYKKSNNQAGIAGVYGNLLLLAYPNLIKMIELGLTAQRIWEKIDPYNNLAIINLGNLGETYSALVRLKKIPQKATADIPTNRNDLLEKSKYYLDKTIERCRKIGDVANEAYFTGVLAETQSLMHDYKNAYENFHKFYEINDSLFSQENKNKIAAIEGEREVAIRDKKIELANLSLSSQKKQQIGLIAGLCLLGIIGGLLFYQSRTRKKTNTTLMMLNNELDEANKIKTKFFSILSHDLRGPVANLINFLHLQHQAPDLLNEADNETHTKKITTSAENLLENMEGLLLWSKGQMEHFKPDKKNVPVSKLFTDIENNFLGTANIKFTFEDSQRIDINTDEDYLKTIMRNLTGNAIKALHNIAGATIEWKAWEENGKQYLSITDNGNGIDEQQLHALNNGDAAVGIKNGLGFHLVRDMAKAIACSISVNSVLGKGTSFQLSV